MPAKRSLILALALLLVAAIPVRATGFPAMNVIDTIRPGVDSSYALWGNGRLGDFLYFGADDGTHGTELWRTNGTTTELVQDINTGSSGADSSSPYGLTALGDFLYFQANDGTHGYELWRTDGTTTELVMDINTGTSGADGSDPSGFTAYGAYLYFRAYESTHGWELWRTNGTTTELVMDINTGTGGADGSHPYALTALGDYLYFYATDGTNRGLWRTDGTTTESVPFPVAGQSIYCDCYDTNIVAVGGRLYTTMYSSDTGHEFAYLDEPSYVLPETSRDGSLWTTTLVILAGLTAAASIGLRVRGAKRA